MGLLQALGPREWLDFQRRCIFLTNLSLVVEYRVLGVCLHVFAVLFLEEFVSYRGDK